MASRITFDPLDQEALVAAAGKMVAELHDQLPLAPWSSQTGQFDAFRKTVQIVTEGASRIDGDAASKEAIVFWALTLLHRDSMNFRLATASAKSGGVHGTSRISSAFLDWVGSNAHPYRVVADTVELQLDIIDRLHAAIAAKTLEIASIRAIPREEASKLFEALFMNSFQAFKRAGMPAADAERKALTEALSAKITPE